MAARLQISQRWAVMLRWRRVPLPIFFKWYGVTEETRRGRNTLTQDATAAWYFLGTLTKAKKAGGYRKVRPGRKSRRVGSSMGFSFT